MTLNELPVGSKFQTPTLKRKRRVLTKIGNLGMSVHLLTKQEIPGGAQYIQHDDKGKIISIPHCAVQTSSKQKFDLPADMEVLPTYIP